MSRPSPQLDNSYYQVTTQEALSVESGGQQMQQIRTIGFTSWGLSQAIARMRWREYELGVRCIYQSQLRVLG
jgi:hypothetical protein